jgi:hypothetical protein
MIDSIKLADGQYNLIMGQCLSLVKLIGVLSVSYYTRISDDGVVELQTHRARRTPIVVAR